MKTSPLLFLLLNAAFLTTSGQPGQVLPQQNLAHWPGIPTGNYSGITPLGNSRYAVVSDKAVDDGFFIFHIEQDSLSGQITNVHFEGFSGEALNDGALFISKATDRLYCYDGGSSSITRIGGDATVPDATYTEKGKVVIDQAGGIKVDSGKVSVVRRTVTFKHALTSAEATNKAFDLPKKVCTGMEGLVAAAVGGVVQTPGDDFEVVDGGTKSTLQWTGKGLADIALVEGDVFVLTYPTDEA